MNKIYLFFLLICSFFALKIHSQNFTPLLIEGKGNGSQLLNPFLGGLNSPQFNSVDFNNDGIVDLLVFDRVGNVILPYLRENDNWKYAPEYISSFPEVKEWVLLRDFNADGIEDLFAYSDVPGVDGILAYEGSYQNDTLTFRRMNLNQPFNIIFFELPGGGRTNLRVTKIDYPAIDDIDCDGDLDILTFNVGGGQIELFQNRSVENGFGTDSLDYKLVEFCWGGIFETGFTKEVELANAQGGCATPNSQPNIDFRHAGSTLLTIDMDNDNDKDLILGDLSFDNLNYLQNGGDCTEAWINAQENDFPSNSIPVEIFSYPAAFSLDLDGDQIKDLIAAPNLLRGAENLKASWFYKNTGSNELPVFEFQQNDFLIEDMFDLGGQSHPAFADIDNDGLMDMVVGNAGFFKDFQISNSGLYLFKNTGSANIPVFELIDSNYLNMNRFNSVSFNFTPTFGDLDGDGDEDLLVGEESGGLFYAENTAGPGAPMQFGSWQYSFQDINVGLSSSPQIFDLNEDGLMDLVVGEKDGNINFFPNQGTKQNPAFNPDPSTQPNNFFVGKVDTRRPGFILGTSQPLFFYQEGTIGLIAGTENSGIEIYEDINGNLDGEFSIVPEMGIPNSGFKTSIALEDINNDGFLEMAVGNERGGVSFFSTPWKVNMVTSSDEKVGDFDFQIFPNPSSDFINIKLPQSIKNTDSIIKIFSSSGQEFKSWETNELQISKNIIDLPSGLYFIQIISGNKSVSQKFIKSNNF